MENTLSAKDICSIIAACAKSEVTHFSYGNISIEFKNSAPIPPQPTSTGEDPEPEASHQEHQGQNSYQPDDYEPELDEQEIRDYALLTNPELAEELALSEVLNVQRQKHK